MMMVHALNLQAASKWKELLATQETELLFKVTPTNGKIKKMYAI